MAWQIGRSVPRENRRCTAGRYIKVRRANVSPAMTYAYGNADEPAKSRLSPSTLTASMCRRAWTWPDLSLENRKIVFRVSFLSQDIEYSRILNTLSEISPIIPVTKHRSWKWIMSSAISGNWRWESFSMKTGDRICFSIRWTLLDLFITFVQRVYDFY